MNKKSTIKTDTESCNHIRVRLDSPDGQQKIYEAVQQGIQMSHELSQARTVNPKRLREPFTV